MDWEAAGPGCEAIIKNVKDLGEGACCEWNEKADTMTVRLGNNANIGLGRELEFIPSSIRSLTGYAWTEDTIKTLVMEADTYITPAKAIIRAPSLISKCNDLVIDGSASLGGAHMPMRYKWVMTPQGTNLATFDAFVSQFAQFSNDNMTITIPYVMLEYINSLLVVLTIETNLSTSASTSMNIEVTWTKIPTITSSLGNNFTHYIYQPLTLQVGVDVKCQSNDT